MMLIRQSDITIATCTNCGDQNDTPRFKQCAVCRAYYREKHKLLYQKKLERKECIFCHSTVVPGLTICKKHREHYNRSRNIRYHKTKGVVRVYNKARVHQ